MPIDDGLTPPKVFRSDGDEIGVLRHGRAKRRPVARVPSGFQLSDNTHERFAIRVGNGSGHGYASSL
jgi:hypothetical protein